MENEEKEFVLTNEFRNFDDIKEEHIKEIMTYQIAFNFARKLVMMENGINFNNKLGRNKLNGEQITQIYNLALRFYIAILYKPTMTLQMMFDKYENSPEGIELVKRLKTKISYEE